MHPLKLIPYKNEKREEEDTSSLADGRGGEEAEEEKEEVAGRRRNSVVNHRQYGITGKSAINQGSPGTELGNCLLKNRNDVNPGVPASEPARELPFDARIYRQSGK